MISASASTLSSFETQSKHQQKSEIIPKISVILVFYDMNFCQIIWQIFTQGGVKQIHQKFATCRDWIQDLWITMPMPYQLSYVNIQLPA